MALYFLDFDANGKITKDDTGTDIATPEAMHKEARKALSAVAKDDIGRDGETMTYKVLVHDKSRRAVYSVVMTLVGTAVSGSDAL